MVEAYNRGVINCNRLPQMATAVELTLGSSVVDVIRLSVRRFLGKAEGAVEEEFRNVTPAFTLGFWVNAAANLKAFLIPEALTRSTVEAFGEAVLLAMYDVAHTIPWCHGCKEPCLA